MVLIVLMCYVYRLWLLVCATTCVYLLLFHLCSIVHSYATTTKQNIWASQKSQNLIVMHTSFIMVPLVMLHKFLLFHNSLLMLQTGAEQEWKLGQLSLEAAGKGLFSANNQVSVVSVKANSALGMPLLLMKLLLCFLFVIQCRDL